DQHDQIHAFDSNLQTPATSAHRNERWSAPSGGSAAGGDSSSMLGAKDKTAFDQVWYDDHAFSVVQHFLRYAVVGSGHERCKNVGRKFQTLHSILTGCTCPGVTSQET